MPIRSAQPSDIPNLLTLLHLKARFDGCPQGVRATAEKLNATLFSEQPMAYILLAESTEPDASQTATVLPDTSGLPIDLPVGLPVGFASYHFIYSTFLAQPGLWLDDLFIREGYRNQALGTQLVQRLCEIAQQHNCGRIDWTVDVNNAAGMRFYERMGAQIKKDVYLCRLTRDRLDRNCSN